MGHGRGERAQLRGRRGTGRTSWRARFPWADRRRWREGSRREAADTGGTTPGVGRLAQWEGTWEGGLGSQYKRPRESVVHGELREVSEQRSDVTSCSHLVGHGDFLRPTLCDLSSQATGERGILTPQGGQ